MECRILDRYAVMSRLPFQWTGKTDHDASRRGDVIMQFFISVFLAAIRPDFARGLPAPPFSTSNGTFPKPVSQ
jgi:hypothetical protein